MRSAKKALYSNVQEEIYDSSYDWTMGGTAIEIARANYAMLKERTLAAAEGGVSSELPASACRTARRLRRWGPASHGPRPMAACTLVAK